MKICDTIFKAIALLTVFGIPAIAFGVTQKEMEEARTIAAKAYIRYANDGSGYLDDINPKTIAALEASLKPKEKENIKAFLAIPVPTDYKDWNKDKLVEFWVNAFQDKGLLEKGRGGRLRARSQISKMTIAPPQPEAPSPAPQASPVGGASPLESSLSNAADSILQTQPVVDDNANFADEEEVNVDKVKSDTWIYIMILSILVAVVLALVVYAANVFKKTGNSSAADRNAKDSNHAEEIEHYESVISDKQVEIAMLNKKLESALRHNSELKAKIDNLEKELMAQRAGSRMAVTPEEAPVKREQPAPQESSVSTKAPLRSIFLGRANARGIFVRADRTLNVGHSVFLLNTTDGYSGTFKVADSPAAWSLALSNPKEYLENACTGYDLEDTSGASRIINESAGTAIFEGGCWRVSRKAKIRYE